MSPINIAHVVYSFGAGGIENGIVNLINGLDNKEYYHIIICLTESGEFEDRIINSNFALIELHKKYGNDISVPFKLRNLFKSYSVDIVHLRGWPTLVEGVIGAKLSGKAGIIYGFHGKIFAELQKVNRKKKMAESFMVRFVDRVLTLSVHMKDEFCQNLGVRKNKVNIISNGVDTFKFSPEINVNAVRSEWNFGDNDFIIGSVGRIDAVKDFKTLINGFQIFNNKNKDSKLIIVGEGPEYNRLKDYIAVNMLEKKVILAGFRDDIPQMLRLMDVYVQTSLYEGFSNTLGEAMSTGLPIVATDVGGNSDLIDEGINGFLIGVGDDVELYERLELLYSDRNMFQRMSLNNRNKVIEKFSINRMITEYDTLYRNLYHRVL